MRNILSLISLIFLFGCSSEPTLLEKCIEANFEQKAFVPGTDEDYIRSICSTNFNAYDQSVTSYKECAEKQIAKMNVMLKDWAIEDAKKVCNSQGIY